MHVMMHRPHKRQRRQAAALVVQSFFTMGKKSTAQPRPAMHVPPRGIGPISEPNVNDVLCGRGGRINAHEGNVQFREIVVINKKEYLAKTTKKLEKAHIAARVIEHIRTMNPPGRFLKEDSDTGLWYDIGDAKAIKKAGQALREDGPDIREEGDSGDDDDDAAAAVSKKPSSPKATTKETSPPIPKTAPLAPASSAGRGANHRVPTSGRGQQHHASWHSSGSSFGMNFQQQAPHPPQRYPEQPHAFAAGYTPSSSGMSFPATSSVGFPATSSVGSAQHSLQSKTPGQLYQGMRSAASRTAGTLSKRAAEIMHFQNQQAHAYRQAHSGTRPPPGDPDDFAFGRVFTPTELSSGSTMSTISGMSGFSNTGSNLTGSHLGGAPSALSLGSSGMGPHAEAGNSLRFSQLRAAQAGRPNGRGSQVSDMTNSFMSSSGLTRSPSFGDVSSSIAIGMSDSSFAALMSEDKQISNILSNMPPPDSSGTSSNSRLKNTGPTASSAMSITSAGSNKSMMASSIRSMESDNSWLRPYQRGRNTKGSISSGEQGDNRYWADDRSLMSDVSESIVALDLAGPSHM
jgi:hypothetical protein